MQKKIATITLLLLLVLTVSLFINLQPVRAASTDLYDVFALKEYKWWSAYNPSFTFSKSSSSVLQMMSNDAGFGDAYAMMSFDKDYLNGKKLRASWRWYLDWYDVSYTLSWLYVVDNDHNRRLNNQGEFRTQNDIEHPIADYTSIPALSRTATCNGGWISWQTDTSNIIDLSGFQSPVVTVMFKCLDTWIQDTVGLEIDYLQVLDSNNNVLKEYHFTGSVFMENTGDYYDYGLIRKPSCVLWGTSDYDSSSGGTDERDASDGISDYIRGTFYDTYKYQYLEDYWGDYTQPNNVYSSVEYSERYYDYSVFFYKGHYWKRNSVGDCQIPGCSYYHRGIVDDEGYPGNPLEVMKDYYLHVNVNEGKELGHKTRGTHDFVFLWACMHGDTNWLGDITDHSWGMAASLMDIEDTNTALGSDGYYYPDYKDHVFISFDYTSPWYTQAAQNDPYNYGHFVYLFFYYALDYGYTVSGALDAASWEANGCSYYSSNLRYGESVYDPINYDWSDITHMKVYGDGSYRLPR